jgi:Rrf2 family protein
MRISAKADYAVRAAAELAAAPAGTHLRAEQLAQAQAIPVKFLLNILRELKLARLVQSHRGAQGGYRLARSPDRITLAEVIRAVEGPLANVHESTPESLSYPGPAEQLREIWIAGRANLRAVLERVTLADLARGNLPDDVLELARHPEARLAR